MSCRFRRNWVLMATAGLLIVIAGCRQVETSSTKRARLIAAQDMARDKTIADLNARIGTLTQQLREKDEQLATYRRKIEASQTDAGQAISERSNQVTAAVLDENVKLRKEIESLRAQLQRRTEAPSSQESRP